MEINKTVKTVLLVVGAVILAKFIPIWLTLLAGAGFLAYIYRTNIELFFKNLFK